MRKAANKRERLERSRSVREALMASGMTQTEVGARTCMDASWVNRVANGDIVPTVVTALLMARAAGTTVEAMFASALDAEFAGNPARQEAMTADTAPPDRWANHHRPSGVRPNYAQIVPAPVPGQ